MIVSCSKKKLNALVQTALRGVSSRTTMPILSGILINAEDGKLIFSSTDLEISIRAEIEAEVSMAGSTVVSGRYMGDIVKNLPSGKVVLETDEKYLTLSTEIGEYRIREMLPEDFPATIAWGDTPGTSISGAEFMLAVQQTSKASSTDEKRPVLTGTLLEKESDKRIKLVATDGYRLSWKTVELGGELLEWEDVIIPTKTLNEVSRLISLGVDDIEIKLQGKQALFKVGDTVIASRLIEGQFPNYRQLVPKEEKTLIRISRDDITGVVRRALIFGKNIRLDVSGDRITVSTETEEIGDSKEEITAEISGEEVSIGFNGHYFLDGISSAETENVELKFDDPRKPSLIRNDKSDNYNYIVMPVRLK